MFCRIFQVQYSPEQRASILAFIDSAADEVQGLDGVESGVVVETGTGGRRAHDPLETVER